jgi:hypothetical protein
MNLIAGFLLEEIIITALIVKLLILALERKAELSLWQ